MVDCRYLAALVAVLSLLIGSPVDAQQPDETPRTSSSARANDSDVLEHVGVGGRVGGYGFRHAEGDKLSWTDCRMNGIGAFGTWDFSDHFFAELGFDHYFATGPTIDSGMDRKSGFVTAALGLRMLPDTFISPYMQIGGGPEWTHIEALGHSTNVVAPSGFVGLGGEINVGNFHFGSHVRGYTMTHPLHEHSPTQAHQEIHGNDEIETEQEVAGQMQFFVRYGF